MEIQSKQSYILTACNDKVNVSFENMINTSVAWHDWTKARLILQGKHQIPQASVWHLEFRVDMSGIFGVLFWTSFQFLMFVAHEASVWIQSTSCFRFFLADIQLYCHLHHLLGSIVSGVGFYSYIRWPLSTSPHWLWPFHSFVDCSSFMESHWKIPQFL